MIEMLSGLPADKSLAAGGYFRKNVRSIHLWEVDM